MSHCEKTPHNDANDIEIELSSLEVANVKEVEYRDMLDRSWMVQETEAEDYKTELPGFVSHNQDMFMSMICSVHMDLDLEEKEDRLLEDQTALADNITVI